MSQEITRRTFVKETLLASAGATLGAALSAGSASAESVQAPQGIPPAKNALPKGKIGKLEFSRLMLGGNFISGWAHSRDLPYIVKLAQKYNTEAKVIETLELAEAHGIDSINVAIWDYNQPLYKHRKQGGKMKWVVAANPTSTGEMTQVQQAIDSGADVVYMQGVAADRLVAEGKMDWIVKEVEFIQSHGLPAGVGAHAMRVIVECEKAKVGADFYQKTLHSHDYFSAPRPGENGDLGVHDNSWCRDPREVVDFMKNVTKPWIAFKVMAAGAIPPRKAFQFAFEGGADFVLAGMFDWQVAEDTQTAREVLAGLKRARPWRG